MNVFLGLMFSIVVFAVTFLAITLGTQYLWNHCLVPAVNCNQVGYWQMYGITWLAAILFKNASFVSKNK